MEKPPARPAKKAPAKALKPDKDGVVRLSGGNPQIAKGHGDAPVQAYIAAMPGWKSEAGQRIDAIITATFPNVKKAVKWNSPFYGLADGSWFTSFHAYDRYIKLTFFQGVSMKPAPPVVSKMKNVRYLHIHEDDLDEKQFTAWIRQAAKLPGEKL